MSGVTDFLLLQINDALFPIGGYSHSYGLETYIQKGIVRDADTAEKYILQNIKTNLLYNELLLIRLAWEYASEDNLEAILELEEIAEASRSQKEIREASRKLGSRFLKPQQDWISSMQAASFCGMQRRQGNVSVTPAHMECSVLRQG